MNTVSLVESAISINNSVSVTNEVWFIPLDIFAIMCTTIVVGLASLSLLIIVLDKTCHTAPMILIGNSCLSALLFGSDMLWLSIFTLQNDLKQIQFEDSLCAFRGYLVYSLCALHNYSYLLQSIYRYITVIHPFRLLWKTVRTQTLLIGVTSIYAFVFPIPFLYTNQIIYNVDNQICQVTLRLAFPIIFIALCVYVIPVLLLLFIYLKLIRYIRGMNERVTPVNTILRARRELKIVRRTITLVIILFTIGFPYALFVFISFFTHPPKYHLRISFISMDIALLSVMITLFQFTDAFKIYIKKILSGQASAVEV